MDMVSVVVVEFGLPLQTSQVAIWSLPPVVVVDMVPVVDMATDMPDASTISQAHVRKSWLKHKQICPTLEAPSSRTSKAKMDTAFYFYHPT